MIVKTITCHDVYNAGASLQAYALMTYLKKLGCDVEIIDYKPDYLSGHFRLWGGVPKRYDKLIVREFYCLAKFPFRLHALMSKRKKLYDEFKNKFLICTKKQYHSYEELCAYPPIADIFFAGSDQIWNPLFKNGNDPSFYLQFVRNDAVCASYAASFAVESIDDKTVENISPWLKTFQYISVRELTGKKIVEKIGLKAECVLDPVFLLSKSEWLDIEEKINIKSRYVLIYDFDKSNLIVEVAKKISEEFNLKIFSILPCSYCDKDYYNSGPREFITLIENAEFIVSNSFHATAFSIILGKQFWVCKRKQKINTRMTDFLEVFELGDRLLESTDDLNFNNTIDYNYIEKKLAMYSQKSKSYIKKVISND